MWLSTEEARSDFILAASALVFGTLVIQFVIRFLLQVSLYPTGQLSLWLWPIWIAVLMIIPSRFFARYRDQGTDAYGLVGDRAGWQDGLLIAAPLVAAGYLRSFSDGGVLGALLGRLRAFAAVGGTIASFDPLTLVLGVLFLGAAGVGSVMLFGLLTVRARDGFRAIDMPLLEALRTYGMGAVGIGTALGLLISLADPDRASWPVLVDGLAMVAVILMTDRIVAREDRTSRATVLAPGIVAIVSVIFTTGGGLFSGNLAFALYLGAMGSSVAIVLAVLLETRRSAWAVVPLVAATVWAPTCATFPVGFTSLGC